jgi:hypothetical protein
MKAKLIKKLSLNPEFIEYWLYCEELKYTLSPMAKTGVGHGLLKLSLENCLAIERGYDLDKLVGLEFLKFDQEVRVVHRRQLQESLTNMVLKALELTGNKKFSEEDIVNAFEAGRHRGHDNVNYSDTGSKTCSEYLSSLQPDAWDVEILTEPMNIDEIRDRGKGFLNSSTNKLKLDSNGCLILKTIE